MKKLEGGLRLKGKSKKKPLITIVTVVRNGEKTLERTIKSVINQTARKEIEYIIIDGNSTDKTLNIIKRYNNKIDYWLSEPDKGIYDAMNKGVLLAKGEYIQFMNADDYFILSKSLESIIKYLRKDVDILSGRMSIIRNGVIINNCPYRKVSLKDLKKGYIPPQPATFMKNKILKEVGFINITYKIVGDSDLFFRCFLKNYNILQVDKTIINFSSGGVSSDNYARVKETTKSIKENFGRAYALRYFFINFPPALLEKIFRIIGILNTFRKLKDKVIISEIFK